MPALVGTGASGRMHFDGPASLILSRPESALRMRACGAQGDRQMRAPHVRRPHLASWPLPPDLLFANCDRSHTHALTRRVPALEQWNCRSMRGRRMSVTAMHTP